MGLFMVLLWSSAAGARNATCLYKDTTGEATVHFCWKIEHKADGQAIITSQSLDETFVNVCLPDGRTRRWDVTRPDMHARAVVKGQRLVMEGQLDGEKVSWDEPLKGRTWYQPLSFALRDVAGGSKSEAEFFCLRPDNLEPMSMTAQRKGLESIDVNGSQVEAVRVQVRLRGLLSIAWHGDYWFRTKDNLFVRYEGVNGPPGTPKTVIELVQTGVGWKSCRKTLGCRLAVQ
jgi:hypothetical protein